MVDSHNVAYVCYSECRFWKKGECYVCQQYVLAAEMCTLRIVGV